MAKGKMLRALCFGAVQPWIARQSFCIALCRTPLAPPLAPASMSSLTACQQDQPSRWHTAFNLQNLQLRRQVLAPTNKRICPYSLDLRSHLQRDSQRLQYSLRHQAQALTIIHT